MPLFPHAQAATVQPVTSSTANATTVPSATASTTLLAANSNRKGATIYNSSTATLSLELGATAAAATAPIVMLPSDYYEVPFGYTGQISGIWSAANGNAIVREFV